MFVKNKHETKQSFMVKYIIALLILTIYFLLLLWCNQKAKYKSFTIFTFLFNGSLVAKLIKSIPLMLLPWNLYGRVQLVWKITIILEKLWFLLRCEMWGNFLKNWCFANNFLILSLNLEILFHTCYSYNCDYPTQQFSVSITLIFS